MKKFLLWLSIPALMMLDSCMREDIVTNDGEEVTASVTINLPGNEMQSRAVTDAPTHPERGNMRLFLFVYENEEIINTIPVNGVDLTTSYEAKIRLVTGKDYKIAAWADYGSSYYTVENGVVTLPDTEIKGNDTYNDAYYVCEDVNLKANETVTLTLKRPFGLVQVTTTDWNEAAVVADRPENYSTTINVPTKLTLLNGVVDENADVNFSGVITSNKLSFDYIFASETESALNNFTMDYGICTYDFANIPVRRNYITNITGNVLTKEGALQITVDPTWDGQYDRIIEVSTVEGLKNALKNAQENDVIMLAEGTYDLAAPTKEEGDLSAPYGYYMHITKNGLTLIANGDVKIYTTDEAAANIGGVGCLQNLVTVDADDVTFQGITFEANYNNYYQGPNKIVLVQGKNFMMEDCEFITNTLHADVLDCGAAVYFAGNADNGVVKNSTINYGTISFDGLMTGNFEITGNTFVEGNDNFAFTTPNWTSNDVTTSKLYVNIEGNTFEGFEVYAEGVNPVVRAYYGILNLKDNKFPTDGIYWYAAKFGSIFVNYNSVVSQNWSKDRTEPYSFAISNDVIEFETMTAPANDWYAWHGRKAAVDMNAKSSWEVTSTLTLTGEDRSVNKSMWVNIGIDWPIVLFKQDKDKTRSWKYWDSTGEGAWVDVPAEKNIPTAAGEYKIKIVFNNGVITEYINDVQIASYEVSEKTTAVKEIIFNSYSIGESYKTTWTYPVVK